MIIYNAAKWPTTDFVEGGGGEGGTQNYADKIFHFSVTKESWYKTLLQ